MDDALRSDVNLTAGRHLPVPTTAKMVNLIRIINQKNCHLHGDAEGEHPVVPYWLRLE